MAFPRTYEPSSVSALWLPTGLRQRGHSGKIQVRNITQIGWVWRETWELVNTRDVDHMALFAYIRNAYNRQVIFDIKHLLSPGSGLARNGSGTPAGAITVNGAAQTGSTLSTTGWPISTSDCVRAGDLIATEQRVHEVSADASSDGSGVCAIPVTPNVFESPANGATVTISDVVFRSMIWDMPKFSGNRSPSYYSFDLGFVEVVP